jgi:hypothetical protein
VDVDAPTISTSLAVDSWRGWVGDPEPARIPEMPDLDPFEPEIPVVEPPFPEVPAEPDVPEVPDEPDSCATLAATPDPRDDDEIGVEPD